MSNQEEVRSLIAHFSGQTNIITIPKIYIEILDDKKVMSNLTSNGLLANSLNNKTLPVWTRSETTVRLTSMMMTCRFKGADING